MLDQMEQKTARGHSTQALDKRSSWQPMHHIKEHKTKF